ncbi:MAG: histidinol dehydrogenase [Lewinellaceae bacterium]|nr:histidinol dehydrogenase [Lewinellaceae bacterium]
MIKVLTAPQASDWDRIVRRPTREKATLDNQVKDILATVKDAGDQALLAYTEQLDGVRLSDLAVAQEDIGAARVDDALEAAMKLAKNNIEQFHRQQLRPEPVVETTKGVKCWRKNIPIEKVGLYIPGGSAPLFSTVLMLGVPAMLAGCREIVLCTPPDKQGNVHPAILRAAALVGISKIFKAGGAQAIAAMAYGTESIPAVYKIFGPGNQFVTKAKELVQQDGIAIDMPAGPSELLIIADSSSNPAFVAADLLSQAEHGADSQVVLLCTDRTTLEQTLQSLEQQLAALPRKDIAAKALENSFAVLLPSLEACIELSNRYAPEHLILATKDNQQLVNLLQNAGSVFLGNYSCESVGDYASGTNHTLPTNGNARLYSGVSCDSFVKKITFQELSAEGIQNIGPAVATMAAAEQLFAHQNAITLRLNELNHV